MHRCPAPPAVLPARLLPTCLLPACLVLAALFTGCAADAAGRTADAEAPPAVSPAAEEARVRAALDRFFAAAETHDWRTVDALLAEDFSFYSDDTLVLTREEFLAAMRDDNMEISSLELADVAVEVSADGRLAVARYRATLESSIQGEPYNMQSVETVIFRREDTAWRMTHNHASVKQL